MQPGRLQQHHGFRHIRDFYHQNRPIAQNEPIGIFHVDPLPGQDLEHLVQAAGAVLDRHGDNFFLRCQHTGLFEGAIGGVRVVDQYFYDPVLTEIRNFDGPDVDIGLGEHAGDMIEAPRPVFGKHGNMIGNHDKPL